MAPQQCTQPFRLHVPSQETENEILCTNHTYFGVSNTIDAVASNYDADVLSIDLDLPIKSEDDIVAQFRQVVLTEAALSFLSIYNNNELFYSYVDIRLARLTVQFAWPLWTTSAAAPPWSFLSRRSPRSSASSAWLSSSTGRTRQATWTWIW